MADDPFCFLPKNSSTSKTSVRWRCLISTASLSTELAIIASVEKYCACLSLGIICVDIGSMKDLTLLHIFQFLDQHWQMFQLLLILHK